MLHLRDIWKHMLYSALPEVFEHDQSFGSIERHMVLAFVLRPYVLIPMPVCLRALFLPGNAS